MESIAAGIRRADEIINLYEIHGSIFRNRLSRFHEAISNGYHVRLKDERLMNRLEDDESFKILLFNSSEELRKWLYEFNQDELYGLWYDLGQFVDSVDYTNFSALVRNAESELKRLSISGNRRLGYNPDYPNHSPRTSCKTPTKR